jgi:hypothetical protein
MMLRILKLFHLKEKPPMLSHEGQVLAVAGETPGRDSRMATIGLAFRLACQAGLLNGRVVR